MIKIQCGGELVLKVNIGSKITKYIDGKKYFESAIFDDCKSYGRYNVY